MLLLFFGNAGTSVSGTLAVTDAPDVVAFSGDFPVFAALAITEAGDIVAMTAIFTRQSGTWTPAIKQAETWTPK